MVGHTPSLLCAEVYLLGADQQKLDPPSPNVTLDFELQFDILAEPQTIATVDSTIDGPFCYIYV